MLRTRYYRQGKRDCHGEILGSCLGIGYERIQLVVRLQYHKLNNPELLSWPMVQWGVLVGMIGGWFVFLVSAVCCGLAYVKRRDARKAEQDEHHIVG
jgi:hypothetical protein